MAPTLVLQSLQNYRKNKLLRTNNIFLQNHISVIVENNDICYDASISVIVLKGLTGKPRGHSPNQNENLQRQRRKSNDQDFEYFSWLYS